MVTLTLSVSMMRKSDVSARLKRRRRIFKKLQSKKDQWIIMSGARTCPRGSVPIHKLNKEYKKIYKKIYFSIFYYIWKVNFVK